MDTFIAWSDKYNTGNLVIDYQHQRFARLINDLEEARRNEDLNLLLMGIIIDELANYALYHFKTEEEFMDKVNYSGREEHKELHQVFILELLRYKVAQSESNTAITGEFCDYLKKWLIGHIATEDQKIIKELSAGQGVV